MQDCLLHYERTSSRCWLLDCFSGMAAPFPEALALARNSADQIQKQKQNTTQDRRAGSWLLLAPQPDRLTSCAVIKATISYIAANDYLLFLISFPSADSVVFTALGVAWSFQYYYRHRRRNEWQVSPRHATDSQGSCPYFSRKHLLSNVNLTFHFTNQEQLNGTKIEAIPLYISFFKVK